MAYWGHSSYYVAFLLFSILHEIGHYCMALFYRFEIESVVILPFGAFFIFRGFWITCALSGNNNVDNGTFC
ncbi:hypothetical protein HMPREF0979_00248 [Coprobacillus sp. 8_1_38FAA]|nr:hypothetical protein HMPREF0979_00248 [Coprobacillus sp. 8_1_38FAA]